MHELLQNVFGWVCGQQMAHTWTPGGLPLPCCQRCTGLYAGACFAALLHLWKRPSLNAWFLKAHGLMLLLMVPLGFHWVAQGPVLRTASGVLFGAAVFTFLRLPLAGAREDEHRNQTSVPIHLKPIVLYGVGLGLASIGVPLLAQYGGRWAGWLLAGFSTGGLIALLVVAACDTLVWLNGLSSRFLGLSMRNRGV